MDVTTAAWHIAYSQSRHMYYITAHRLDTKYVCKNPPEQGLADHAPFRENVAAMSPSPRLSSVLLSLLGKRKASTSKAKKKEKKVTP